MTKRSSAPSDTLLLKRSQLDMKVSWDQNKRSRKHTAGNKDVPSGIWRLGCELSAVGSATAIKCDILNSLWRNNYSEIRVAAQDLKTMM